MGGCTRCLFHFCVPELTKAMQAELLEQLEKKKARAARFNMPIVTSGQEVMSCWDVVFPPL